MYLTKKAVNLHVTGVYSMKTYKSSADEFFLTLAPALVKTVDKEWLIKSMRCRLVQGPRNRAVYLSERLIGAEEAEQMCM